MAELVGKLGTVPRVLAGPIVRRAEPTAVWIWFALQMEPITVLPRVLPFRPDGEIDVDYVESGSFPLAPYSKDDLRTIRIAESAWICLVRLRPRGGRKFPTDVLLGYTFQCSLKEKQFWLHDEVPNLAYEPFSLPTFFLSAKPRSVAHGSCRRPGADGPDAFPALDTFFKEKARTIEERPYALLLTGDQIYADDLAEALFDSIQDLSHDLFGYYEEILGDKQPVTTNTITFKQRHDFVLKTLGFTTQDEGHLLSFAEYAAMYLIVWGPGVYAVYNPEAHKDLLKTHQGENLVGFGETLIAARRVMANVATYMMFDDHDVTDDWFMDYKWIRNTDRDSTRVVIGNAMFCYWVFQAWGNDPEGLEWMRKLVNSTLQFRRSAKGKYRQAYMKANELIMYKVNPWSYVPPIVPQILVVNTRTQRQYPSNPLDIAARPILVGKREIAHVETLAKAANMQSGKLLVLVVATPLFNLPFVEAAAVINYLRGKTVYDDDHELFTDNPGARDYFLNRIQTDLKPDSIIAFSGDVHHSFMIQAKLDFIDDKQKVAQHIEVLQITSSPIKNMNSNFEGKMGKAADMAEEVLHDESIIDYDLDYTLGFGAQTFCVLEYKPLPLKGPLGHKTFIPQNCFCVVDFRKAPGSVDVLYMGMDGKKVITAGSSVPLKPTKLDP